VFIHIHIYTLYGGDIVARAIRDTCILVSLSLSPSLSLSLSLFLSLFLSLSLLGLNWCPRARNSKTKTGKNCHLPHRPGAGL
jgi:hypothetical protein